MYWQITLFFIRHRLLGFLAVVLLGTQSYARIWKPEEVPVPYLQDARRYVSNPENILSTAAADSIDRILFALERDKGVQTLVIVLDKLEGDNPYDFAMTMARKHGVGSKEKRTGLVVVLATGDRSYQFLTGNGLEATLPDAIIQRIEDRVFVPHLKREDWDKAMVEAIAAIDRVCRGDDTLTKASKKPNDGSGIWIFVAAMVVFLLLLLSIARHSRRLKKQPRLCPKCGQKELRWHSHRNYHAQRGKGRIRVYETIYRCSACGHVQTDRHEDNDDFNGGAALLTGALLAGMMRGGRHSGGGSFGGGSFGGGSFGGGGSGGRF